TCGKLPSVSEMASIEITRIDGRGRTVRQHHMADEAVSRTLPGCYRAAKCWHSAGRVSPEDQRRPASKATFRLSDGSLRGL
ncbi:MAG: hypothetical protein K8F25_12435, partial [Fimbriimonadaceae bacterium]|nr:hypothetical protein [Alphaproteobacteria bacterium]